MISFEQVNKYYGDFHVLKDINLTIQTWRSGRHYWTIGLW